jgi:hypothetical protein
MIMHVLRLAGDEDFNLPLLPPLGFVWSRFDSLPPKKTHTKFSQIVWQAKAGFHTLPCNFVAFALLF